MCPTLLTFFLKFRGRVKNSDNKKEKNSEKTCETQMKLKNKKRPKKEAKHKGGKKVSLVTEHTHCAESGIATSASSDCGSLEVLAELKLPKVTFLFHA